MARRLRPPDQPGYRVTIVQNPLTSLEDDVAATTRVLDLQDGPTILVGHSWGGTVITQAGLHDKVAGLVYVAALCRTAARAPAQQYEGFAATPDFVINIGEDGFGFLDPDKFKRASRPTPVMPRPHSCGTRRCRSTCPSSRSRSTRPRGGTSRAGRSSAPRTRRSTRPCSSTWRGGRRRHHDRAGKPRRLPDPARRRHRRHRQRRHCHDRGEGLCGRTMSPLRP